ncbi:MAG TPA: tripartite tricarboxylate transporter substrate binding protein, partial [Burkholderiaceae bacterium]|nr:tripartite tricarboxylate transporter substrate binding protein [Burkholderiaceae bacterium]
MIRRTLLASGVAALCTLGAAGAAFAQATAYPAKPIKWIVPFPPAGAMDTIARTLGEHMGRTLGQTFVIENRPGAGGNIGVDAVARAAPDGYTMMIVANGMAVNKFLFGKLSYDPVKDFAPVSLVAVVPNVLVTNATRSKARTVADLIAEAKTHPGKVTYASAGNGTSIHLAAELFASLARVDMLHIPYKGSGPAVSDLIGGQVDTMFDSVTSAAPHIKSGKLRALGVTTAKRSSALPDVPTIAEAGLPGYELSPWFAVYMPAGTPQPIVDRINAALLQAMKAPEVKSRFAGIGAEPV